MLLTTLKDLGRCPPPSDGLRSRRPLRMRYAEHSNDVERHSPSPDSASCRLSASFLTALPSSRVCLFNLTIMPRSSTPGLCNSTQTSAMLASGWKEEETSVMGNPEQVLYVGISSISSPPRREVEYAMSNIREKFDASHSSCRRARSYRCSANQSRRDLGRYCALHIALPNVTSDSSRKDFRRGQAVSAVLDFDNLAT